MKLLYTAYKQKIQAAFDVSYPGHPYAFLRWMWMGMMFTNVLSLAVGVWYFFVAQVHSPYWFMYSAFLSCGPISMAISCAAPVAASWQKHVLFSGLTAMSIALFSIFILPHNPILLGVGLWAMMMFGIFQSRLHERREVNWTTHEDTLAMGAGFVALSAYALIPTAPWLIVGLLVAVPCLQRVVLWRFLRTQALSLGQHETVWPRMAKNMSPSDFLASLIFYVTLRDGVPSAQLRRALLKVDIATLLAYFNYKTVFQNPASPLWQHQDLSQAVKECVCTMDARAIVVFELYSSDTPEAARCIKKMRANKIKTHETVELPDLGSTA